MTKENGAAPGEDLASRRRVEGTIMAVGRERAALIGALCSEAVVSLAARAPDPEETTLDELMQVVRAFTVVGLQVQRQHPETHAKALRVLARGMFEEANRIDPEGAPS